MAHRDPPERNVALHNSIFWHMHAFEMVQREHAESSGGMSWGIYGLWVDVVAASIDVTCGLHRGWTKAAPGGADGPCHTCLSPRDFMPDARVGQRCASYTPYVSLWNVGSDYTRSFWHVHNSRCLDLALAIRPHLARPVVLEEEIRVASEDADLGTVSLRAGGRGAHNVAHGSLKPALEQP